MGIWGEGAGNQQVTASQDQACGFVKIPGTEFGGSLATVKPRQSPPAEGAGDQAGRESEAVGHCIPLNQALTHNHAPGATESLPA